MHQRTRNHFNSRLGNLFVIANLEQRSAIHRQRVPVAAATEVPGFGVIAGTRPLLVFLWLWASRIPL
jgi:hypothetical protein